MQKRFYKQLYINHYQTDKCDIHCLYANGANPRISSDEIHDYYEIIYFLSGDLELITEAGQHRIQPGTAIVLPPHTYHKLLIDESRELYQRMIMGFYSIPEFDALIRMKVSNFALYQSEELERLYRKFCMLFDSDLSTVERDAMGKAFFAQILVHFNPLNQKKADPLYDINPIIQNTIEYINRNYHLPLTSSQLASLQNVSYSYLTSNFKAEMNTTIHNFLLSKRLIAAAEKLARGEKPTQVALDCGFNDYSGFYKQYKKAFRISPSSPQKPFVSYHK